MQLNSNVSNQSFGNLAGMVVMAKLAKMAGEASQNAPKYVYSAPIFKELTQDAFVKSGGKVSKRGIAKISDHSLFKKRFNGVVSDVATNGAQIYRKFVNGVRNVSKTYTKDGVTIETFDKKGKLASTQQVTIIPGEGKFAKPTYHIFETTKEGTVKKSLVPLKEPVEIRCGADYYHEYEEIYTGLDGKTSTSLFADYKMNNFLRTLEKPSKWV